MIDNTVPYSMKTRAIFMFMYYSYESIKKTKSLKMEATNPSLREYNNRE